MKFDHLKNGKFLLVWGLVLCSQLGFSQNVPTPNSSSTIEKAKARILQDNKVEKVFISEERETPFMITYDLERVDGYALSEAERLIEQNLGINKSIEDITYDKSIKMKGDMEYQRFFQLFNGVKVEHGGYAALGKSGRLSAINGSYFQIENINTTPTIDKESALQLAKEAVGADYTSIDYLEENYRGVIAPELTSPWYKAYQEYGPQTELVIVDDFHTKGQNQDLAWKFNIYAFAPNMSRDYVYINAHTGKEMFRDPIIKHWNNEPHTAEVITRYSGTQTIHTTRIENPTTTQEPNPFYTVVPGGPIPNQIMDSRGHADNVPFTILDTEVYVLIDQTRGSAATTIETYDVNGAGGVPVSVPIYGIARSFTDDDNIWNVSEHNSGINGAAIPSEREYDDDIAWDAHWGAGRVYDYWADIHGRDSYNDAGAPILSYVHIGNAFDNAFWNGSVMSYGDGQSFKSLTSLDVCGHEVGHAVCSNTSNLVYALESGGMNEGFSDIWAACQEYFEIKVTPSLAYHPTDNPTGYRPYGIGEQIHGTLGNALRWMDNPKISGDPETYNGEDFTRAEGCSPSLANDQCGVHSNSGVLNKWFYLLTTGSGAGSGPAAQYAGTGANADDGIVDNVTADGFTADNGYTYNVTGLGFEISELIAFGCEVGLMPTSTFAEARTVSIQFARAKFGACSPEEESTTNAWYGVGVGAEFANCDPSLRLGFSDNTQTITETTFGINECEPVQTLSIPLFFSAQNFSTTITIDPSSTATEGKDYTVSNLTFNHDGSAFKTDFLTVNIIDDGINEGVDETIIFNIDPNLTSTEYATHTIIIKDDDIDPTVGNNAQILYFNEMNITAGNLPAGMIDKTPPGSPNRWTGGAAQSLGSEGSGAIIDNNTTSSLTVDEYNNTAAAENVILHSPLIDARLKEGVTVTFTWGAGGESALAGLTNDPVDYGELVYSFDGNNFIGTGDVFVGTNGGATPATGTFVGEIPELADKQFYVGWRWQNDDVGGGPLSFSIGELTVTAKLRGIETAATSNVEERVDQGTGVFFKSYQDGDLICKIANPTEDLDCVEAVVIEGGETAKTFLDADRSPKVFQINSDKYAKYDLTLYLTNDELGSLDMNSLKIGKVVGDVNSPDGVIIDEATTVATVGTDGVAFTSMQGDGAFQGFGQFVLTTATETDLCPGVDDNQIGQPCDDGNSCTANDIFTIDCQCLGEVTNAITLEITPTNDNCGNGQGSAEITNTNAIAPYTIFWSTGATGDENNTTLSNLSAGTYTASITDANTCSTETVTFVINDESAIIGISEAITNIECNGASTGRIQLTLSGTITPTIDWSDDTYDGMTDLMNLPAGTYSVTVSEGVVCSASETYILTEGDAIGLAVNTTDATSCKGETGTATAMVTNAATYDIEWETENGSPISVGNETNNSISNLSAGNYVAKVTSGNCTATPFNFTIIDLGSGFTLTDVVTNVNCNAGSDGKIELTPSTSAAGQVSYLWDANANNATTATVSNLPAGSYSVTATDVAGCETMNTYTINQPAAIGLSVNPTDATCGQSNGEAMATIAGAGANPQIFWSTNETTTSISNLAAGDYSVFVIGDNDCRSETIEFTIGATGVVTATLTKQDEGDCGTNSGSVTATPAGGNPTGNMYNFSWSNGFTESGTSSTIMNLAADDYTVTINDGNGCSDFFSTIIECTPTTLATTLISFSASLNAKSEVALNWETANESNFSHYEVERSANTVTWNKIAKVLPTFNTSNNYGELDKDAATSFQAGSIVYYRLRMIHTDGSFDYSKVLRVQMPTSTDRLSVFPNPTKGAVNLTFQTEQTTTAILNVLSFNGQLVKTIMIDNPSTISNQQLNLSDMAKGVYFLQLQLVDGNRQVKVVVE